MSNFSFYSLRITHYVLRYAIEVVNKVLDGEHLKFCVGWIFVYSIGNYWSNFK